MYPAPPDEGGHATWFADLRDVPDGWEFREEGSEPWFDIRFADGPPVGERCRLGGWVQCRPKRAELPHLYVENGVYVVAWGDVKTHPDRNRLEWYTSKGEWRLIDPNFTASDTWALSVRYKSDPAAPLPVQDGYPVVAAKHLKGRDDLDEWYRLMPQGHWVANRWGHLDEYDDEYPFRVRRRLPHHDEVETG